MKKVTLKKLSVENYKKFEAKEFDFTGRTEVSGRNRQGKTSLMDAYFDVLTGKLADGTLPNNIRRKVDGEEVDDPVVRELVIDVDGTEYVVQKKTARENHDRITSLLYTLKSDKKNAESKLRLAEMDLEHANKGIERHKAALAQAKKKYTEALKEKWDGDTELTAIRGEEFDPALAICPTCGQTLPEEQVETAKRKFEFNKQSRISKKLGEKEQFEKNKRTKLEQITEDGNEASEGLKAANETKKEAEAAIEATKKEITSLALEIAETEKEVEKPIPEPDMSGNEEYKAVCDKISALEESLNGIGNGENDRILLSNNRHSLEAKLRDVEAKIKTQTARLEEKANNLETMQEEQKKLSQKQANIQQKVDQLTEYSIEKNKALAAVINPHFKHFQFQFLDYTQDGEPLETCRMICNGIDYANGLNHSDRILCDIDLVMGLQEMNDLRLPVWVDDTESINSDRIPELDTQMILLKVSDGELSVKNI